MCATANRYTWILEGSEDGGEEEDEKDGGEENYTSINVSSN
jgi:hypothetical protein